MAYLNTQTNEYPLHVGDLMLLGIQEENLPDFIVPVIVELPEWDGENEICREITPSQDESGIWKANFEIVPLTIEQKKMIAIQKIKTKIMTDQNLTDEEIELLKNK